MQSILGFALQDVVNIGEAYVPFEGKFVCVTGHNKDSRISSRQNNASGKSTIFNAIANVLYESDPMAAKKDRKAMLRSGDSKIQLDLRSAEGNDLTVLQTASKYYLSDEKGDLKANKIADAQRLIHENFPITESEFYAYCYINGNKPFDFQHATPTNRFTFLAKLFRLDVYDVIRTYVKKLRDQAAKSQVQYDAIHENIAFLEKKLADNAWNTQNDYKEKATQEELEELEAESTKLYDTKASMEANAKYHRSRQKYEKQLKDAKLILKDLEVNKKQQKALVKVQREIEKYLDYKDALAKYKKRKAAIEEELAHIDTDALEDPNKLRKRYNDLAQKLVHLEEHIVWAEDQNEIYDATKERIAKLEKKVKDFEPVDRKAMIKEANNLEQIVDMAEELEGESSCPTCGSKVDRKKLAKKAKTAAKRIKEIDKLVEQNEVYEELLKLKIKFGDMTKHKIKPKKKEVKELERKLKRIDEIGSQSVAYQKLNAKLEALEKPKKVKKPTQLKLQNDIDDLVDAMDVALSAKSYLKSLPEVEFNEKKFKKIEAALAKNAKKYSKVRKKHVNYSVRKSEHYALTDQIQMANREAKKLEAEVNRKKLYDSMYKLYGKELKGIAINDRLAQLEAVMNENAYLLFSESMKFTFKADGDKVEARVLRENGIASDISKLSGSESNCFRLLFAYSLLPILPSDRRTNFMILDEPDAACDPEIRDHIIKNFVPHLKQAVPNVFWITPKDVSSFDGCEHWRVIKHNGQSTLKKVGA